MDGAVQKAKCGTAWSARAAAYSTVAGIDLDPLKAGQLKEWATPYWKGVHPYDLAGAYTNFMMGGDGEERIKVSFGDNYPRLKALNAKYDPTNLSRVNQACARPIDDDASRLRQGSGGFGLRQRRPSCLIRALRS
jgi:Berberine and berberine like